MQTGNMQEIVITSIRQLCSRRSSCHALGFAAVVSAPSGTVLFDTGGDGAALLSNMEKLRLDPAEIQSVVISHIHQDHIGGLRSFLGVNAKVVVLIPQSFPDDVRNMIGASGASHRDVAESIYVTDDVRTTGPLGTPFQEQTLVVEASEGLVVIMGCAHPGIVSIVEKARTGGPEAEIALGSEPINVLPLSTGS